MLYMSQSDSINLSSGIWNSPFFYNTSILNNLNTNNLMVTGSSNLPIVPGPTGSTGSTGSTGETGSTG